jgi:hypothetical protein
MIRKRTSQVKTFMTQRKFKKLAAITKVKIGQKNVCH